MRKPKRNDTAIIFRCSAEFRDRLCALAAEQCCTNSDVIRQLVAAAAAQRSDGQPERRVA